MRSTDTRRTPGGRAVLAGVLVALVALAALTAPAAAGYDDTETIYVDDDWTDKQVGNSTDAGYVIGTNATASIQAAINMAEDGDTILVKNGMYEEQVVVNKDVTVQAVNEHGATIRYAPTSSTGQPTVKLTQAGEHGGPTLDGFVVERVAADGRSTGANFAQGIRVSASDAEVKDNNVTGIDFEDASNAGIMVIDGDSGSSSGEEVTNVRVIDNDVSGFEGALSAAANYGGSVKDTLFDGNDLSENDANGLVLGNGAISNVTLDNAEYTGTDDHAHGEVRFKTADAALAWGADAQGATIENDATGNHLVTDGMSIQDAIGAASDGDTITVQDGTYAGFTVTKNVTITAADGAEPTVDADEGVANNGVVSFRDSGGNADNATISGLTVNASDQSTYTTGVSVSADHVTLRDIKVLGDSSVTGIQTTTGYDGNASVGTLIVDSEVHGANLGISLQNGSDVVRDNTVTGGTQGIAVVDDGHTVVGNDVSTAGSGAEFVLATNVRPVSDLNGASDELEMANAIFDDNPEIDSIMAFGSGHDYARDVSIGETYYHSIQAALDAAEDGDTVSLAAGTYAPTSDLDVSTANVTLAGAGQGDTVIDTNALSHYGIDVKATGSTFEGFTLVGPQNVSDGDKWDNFGMHIGDGQEYISTTVRDVTVKGSALTELDLIGVDGATIENVTLRGQDTAGAGLGLSDAKNVSVDGITTTNNTWGGTAVMTNGQYGLPAETANVNITGVSSTGEPSPVYLDPMHNGRENITDLSLPGMEYRVTADDYRDGDFAWFFQSQTDAAELAERLATDGDELPGENTGAKSPLIEELGTGNFYVAEGASIQNALDAVADGNDVHVLSGTYDENVTIDTANVTLAGTDATLNGAVTVNADGVTVSGLEIHGASTSGQNQRFGVYVTAGVGDVTVTGNNLTTTSTDTSRAILLATGGSGGVTIADNHVEGWRTGAFVPVPDVTIVNNTFVDNTAAIGGVEDGTVTVDKNAFDGNSEAIGVGAGDLDLQQGGLVKANVSGYTAYYETIQQAVNNAVSGSTIEVLPGTYNAGATIDKPLTLVAPGDVTLKGTIGFQDTAYPDDVTIAGFTFADAEKAINANNAGNNLTVVGNTFDGVTNAVIHGGESGGQDGLKTGWTLANNDVQNVGDGFRLWNMGDVTVYKNNFENLSGSAVSLIAVDGATVVDNTMVDTTKAGVFVEGPFNENVFDTETKNVTISGNTFDNAGDNASTEYAQASVKTGSVLANLSQVDVHNNAFLNTSPHAIYADDDGDATGEINARFNWFGSEDGPSSDEVTGPVTYDPFLTAPPSETSQQLQQYGHDFTIPADSQPYAVGFPADVDATYGELFSDVDGVVYIFDAEHEKWEQVDADRQVDAMDAVVVVADERKEITVDYEDAASDELTSPGEKNLEAGWNFVAAPQRDDAETAFAATQSGDVTKIIHQYETASSAPYGWEGDDFGTYTFDQTGQVPATAPTVSPYSGYWVYASGDGSLAGSMYPGMTYIEMLNALNNTGGAP